MPSELEIFALTLLSLFRVLVACTLSVVLGIIISYISVSSRKNERLIIGILDVLQSIPVLSFVPGVMLFFTKLGKIGFEISALILITVGTIWNIIFSYYSSLKSIPSEIEELSKILRMGPFTKFLNIHFPFSLTQLTWNLILSFGGGWYFITYCEIFSVGELGFAVKGIGSFIMQKSAEGKMFEVVLGLVSITVAIILTFVFLWFPLIRFSERFKFEQVSGRELAGFSPIDEKKISNVFDSIYKKIAKGTRKIDTLFSKISNFSDAIFFILLISLIFLASILFNEVRKLSLKEITDVLYSIFPSFLRVSVGIALSAAIAIPLGIIIGANKKYYPKIQPAVQILSSLPAPAFIPLIYPIIVKNETTLVVGSIMIIFLSSFWYIFYNTVAGVFSIPSEAFDVAKVLKLSSYDKIKKIILPGASKDIFVGLLTAWGGAWNGSFVAEYIHVGEKEFYLYGIGSFISKSAEEGNVPMLVLSTLAMATFVFIINVLVWQRAIRKTSKRIR